MRLRYSSMCVLVCVWRPADFVAFLQTARLANPSPRCEGRRSGLCSSITIPSRLSASRTNFFSISQAGSEAEGGNSHNYNSVTVWHLSKKTPPQNHFFLDRCRCGFSGGCLRKSGWIDCLFLFGYHRLSPGLAQVTARGEETGHFSVSVFVGVFFRPFNSLLLLFLFVGRYKANPH